MKRHPTVAKPAGPATGLLQDVRELILTARQGVARGVNAALVMLHERNIKSNRAGTQARTSS